MNTTIHPERKARIRCGFVDGGFVQGAPSKRKRNGRTPAKYGRSVC